MEDKNRNDIKRRLEELRKENNRKNDSKDDGNKSPFGSPLVFFTIILIAFTFTTGSSSSSSKNVRALENTNWSSSNFS